VLLFTLNQQTVCGWLGLEPLFRVEWPFLYLSIWAFLVAMVLIIAVSLLTRPGIKGRPVENLKLWAVLALLIQMLIYAVG
jgi:hypothetical protein